MPGAASRPEGCQQDGNKGKRQQNFDYDVRHPQHFGKCPNRGHTRHADQAEGEQSCTRSSQKAAELAEGLL